MWVCLIIFICTDENGSFSLGSGHGSECTWRDSDTWLIEMGAEDISQSQG